MTIGTTGVIFFLFSVMCSFGANFKQRSFNISIDIPNRALYCFSAIMTDLNKGVTKPRHHIRLWRGARSDIVLQICFLEKRISRDHFSWVTFGKNPKRLSYMRMG